MIHLRESKPVVDYCITKNEVNSINVLYSGTEAIPTGDIEISYNLVLNGGGRVKINSGFTPNGSKVYIFRNTFLDEVNVNKVTSTNGEFSFYDNVIVNETFF